MLLEFVLAPAAVVTFISAYVDSLFGISGPLVYAVFYIAFIGLHLYGVSQVLKLMFGIAIVAVIGLLAFSIGMIPHFDVSNLIDIAPHQCCRRQQLPAVRHRRSLGRPALRDVVLPRGRRRPPSPPRKPATRCATSPRD